MCLSLTLEEFIFKGGWCSSELRGKIRKFLSVKLFIRNSDHPTGKKKSHFQEFQGNKKQVSCFVFPFPPSPTHRVDQVTSAAFGGETLQDLYLTTAREDFDEAKSKEFP